MRSGRMSFMSARITEIAPDRLAPLGFVASGALLALALSWLAAIVQAHWAPVLLFPIATGAVLGSGLWLLRRGWPDLKRGTVLAAALIGGLVLVCGQHYFAYRQYRVNYEQSSLRNPQAQLLALAFRDRKPMSLGEFLTLSARERDFGPWQLHGWAVWFSWGLEGLLTLAAAAGVAGFRAREVAAKPQAANPPG